MSTQFVTLDSATYVGFPEPEALPGPKIVADSDARRFADSDFFKGKSITELAREQGVGPIKDIRVLAGGIPDDVDIDELLAQLEEMRGS